MYKTGEIVEVYEDALTMQRKEGNAVVVEALYEKEPGVGVYRVLFVGDERRSVVTRTIAKEPLCVCVDPVHPDNPRCRVHGQVSHYVGRSA